MPTRLPPGPVSGRSCGTCGACCKIFDVFDLRKPAGAWCLYWSQDKCCEIYDDRPRECRSFRCSWIRGYGAEQDRPDLSKVVIDTMPYVLPDAPELVVRIAEVGAGGFQQEYAQRMVRLFIENGFFVLAMHFGGLREILGPPDRPIPAEILAQATTIEMIDPRKAY